MCTWFQLPLAPVSPLVVMPGNGYVVTKPVPRLNHSFIRSILGPQNKEILNKTTYTHVWFSLRMDLTYYSNNSTEASGGHRCRDCTSLDHSSEDVFKLRVITLVLQGQNLQHGFEILCSSSPVDMHHHWLVPVTWFEAYYSFITAIIVITVFHHLVISLHVCQSQSVALSEISSFD